MEFADSHALTGEQCERLENFESFVRQSVGEAHMERFVQTLQALSHAEKRRLAKELEMHAKDGECCRRRNSLATGPDCSASRAAGSGLSCSGP